MTIPTTTLLDADRLVLRELPMDLGCGHWLTAAEVAARLGMGPTVARSTLVRLRRFTLAEDDGERPQRFARTVQGEVELEQRGDG